MIVFLSIKLNRNMMKWTYMLFISLAFCQLQAQKIVPQVMASAGASMKSGTIFVEWTLGEMATETLKSGNLTVTQGFHQPNLIMVSSQNESLTNISVYPNPVSDILLIQNQSEGSIDIQLIEVNGKSIKAQRFLTGTHALPMDQLPSGSYILQVKQGNSLGNFTIEKIK
jgi:Secretion system C-terminal sorting domain